MFQSVESHRLENYLLKLFAQFPSGTGRITVPEKVLKQTFIDVAEFAYLLAIKENVEDTKNSIV